MSSKNGLVHLCGSVPLSNAEEVFRTAVTHLGGLIRRLPDGETGERHNWIAWQLSKLQTHPDLEPISKGLDYGPGVRVGPKPGVDPASVRFGSLGYAEAAIESWGVFSELRSAGVIPPGVRFQVSLPTPIAVVAAYIGAHQDVLEQAYEKRMLEELAEIMDVVPAEDLAVQWDTAVEFGVLEEVFPVWFDPDLDKEAELVKRLVRLGDAVPAEVELGYHLCYGDYEHRHFVQPADTSKLASVATKVATGLKRSLNWVHMPVPRDRDDDAYFEPLRTMTLQEGTKLYLGLVHATDGEEGARRRIAAARKVVPEFGIATECGMGRRPAEQIDGLLALHATLAKSL